MSDFLKSNGLSAYEASRDIFTGGHQAYIWAAILPYAIEPPKSFYATGIHDALRKVQDKPASVAQIGKQIHALERLGMVEPYTEPDSRPGLPAQKNFVRVESAGWKIVETTVEIFGLWVPPLEET